MPRHILYLGLDPTHYSAQGEVTHWPIIQITPRPLSEPAVRDALGKFDHYSHILITSKSTVAILQEYFSQLGIDLHIWAKKSTLAVGKITAKHLEACGITPFRVAKEETAEGLIQELRQLRLVNAHIFWPHSSQARPVIKEFLKRESIRYRACVLYEPLPRPPINLPDVNYFDEIVFTSPSTVAAFLQIFGKLPSQSQIVAIGPITARYILCLPN
jgi:uroporphyrinogen-III synthase